MCKGMYTCIHVCRHVQIGYQNISVVVTYESGCDISSIIPMSAVIT